MSSCLFVSSSFVSFFLRLFVAPFPRGDWLMLSFFFSVSHFYLFFFLFYGYVGFFREREKKREGEGGERREGDVEIEGEEKRRK
ncbi:hypothetical protein F4775DRAFT_545118 [Biscogniauxia sp. FL1348]|nr:hypothetical protein F4775DRAFT_545118 [Biscogniauxia sp. FL1348]